MAEENNDTFLDRIINFIKPKAKAHDEIDSLINQSIEGIDEDLILSLVMGGAGGGGANISKAAKNIISKILAKNAISLKNLRSPVKTGAQTMSSKDKAFFASEKPILKGLMSSGGNLGAMSPEAKGVAYSTGTAGSYLIAQLLRSISEDYEKPDVGLPSKQY
jgi:hypothetical protein